MSKRPTSLPPFTSLLLLVPIFSLVAYFSGKVHYQLPEPVWEGFNKETGAPQFSERLALGHVQALEDCGFRIVGTKEHAAGRDYVYGVVQGLQRECEGVEGMECEVWWQQGDGSHKFAILDHDVLKTFTGLSNIIMRISNGTREAKESALLLNAHIDSQLTGPGAADDAIGVGIMLEILRVKIARKEGFENAVIFLFNDAEECFQDASQLYSTQHETAPTVKAVINLEAAGTTGQEMLFQATSSELVEAYSKVPYPHGTVLAADVFASGIMGSDTDFGVFETYLDVVGLDMAVVGHSWYYHTTKDLVKNIQIGSTQHFGANVLSLVDSLTSPGSALPNIEKKGTKKQTLVYFSFFDKIFVMYELEAAGRIARGLGSMVILLLVNRTAWIHWKSYVVALAGTVGSVVGALVGVNVVALVMSKVLDRSMSWFSHEFLALALYSPPAFLGAWTVQFLLSKLVSPLDEPYLEHATQSAQLVLHATFMALAQYFEIRSGCLFAFLTAWGVVSLGFNELVSLVRGRFQNKGEVSFLSYIIGCSVPTVLGVEAATSALMIFIPLTGRIGEEAPAELIVANLVGILTILFVPTSIPFFHRFGKSFKRKAILCLLATTIGTMVVFCFVNPYDDEHPRRLFFEHEFNTTSGDFVFHAAAMDSAPGVSQIVDEIHTLFEVDSLTPARFVPINSSNPSWSSLYPVGNFFTTFQFPVSTPEETEVLPEFHITAVKDSFDALTNVRSLTLKIEHTGLVWPAIAFSAQILSWPFKNTPPPTEFTRHTFKGASEFGFELYEVSLEVVGNEDIYVDFVGLIENGNWKSVGDGRGKNVPGASRFAALDAYLEETKKGAIDSLMLSTVVGVIRI
ncbi:hypothetical protein BDY24DRAFT_388928 [Mrakia frigida]|uniref:Pff1p n=1 Tax=Mrakia frigida TaxID=29902 RepID=UPI003FCC1912